jgi:phosphoglycolate phosphatase
MRRILIAGSRKGRRDRPDFRPFPRTSARFEPSVTFDPEEPPVIEALILDWAGTLADDVALTLEATNRTLATFGGAPVDLPTYRRDFKIPVSGFYGSRLKGVPIEDVDAAFFAIYERLLDDVRLFDGVEALLHSAKLRGVRLFVLSTVPTRLLRRALHAKGLERLFEDVVGGAFDKKAALPKLLSDRGLPRDATLFVGDTVHDVETAKASNIRSGAALYGYSSREALVAAAPDDAFESIADLLRFFEREWLSAERVLVLPTVGGLLSDGRGRFLFVRTRKWSNTWGLPGGKIDYGETMEEAFRREMREETGLEVDDVRWLCAQDCVESKEFVVPRHFVLVNYVARATNPEALRPNYELEEARFATLDEAEALNLNAQTRTAIGLARALFARKDPP